MASRRVRADGSRLALELASSPVQLARFGWLATVFACLIAVLVLLLQGYYGYAGVTFAVACSAAINLALARFASAAARSPRPARTRSAGSRWISTSAPWSRPRSCPGARVRSGGRFERGACPELDVEVDVAPGARATCAQLVVADDAARRESLDRDRIASTSSSGSAWSTSTREEPLRSLTPVTTIDAETISATTGSSQSAPVSLTRMSPTSTPAEVSASVRRWAASPSSAGESVAARCCSISVETKMLTTIENATTAMPRPTVLSWPPLISRRIASNAIAAEPTRIRIPSIAAERFSIFSWP